MEMSSLHSLPEDTELKKKVLNRTDFVDYEKWAIIIGNKLWNDLISHLDVDSNELAMFFYHKLAALPPKEFSRFTKLFLEGGGKAKAVVMKWVEEIKRDYLEDDEEYSDGASSEDSGGWDTGSGWDDGEDSDGDEDGDEGFSWK